MRASRRWPGSAAPRHRGLPAGRAARAEVPLPELSACGRRSLPREQLSVDPVEDLGVLAHVELAREELPGCSEPGKVLPAEGLRMRAARPLDVVDGLVGDAV